MVFGLIALFECKTVLKSDLIVLCHKSNYPFSFKFGQIFLTQFVIANQFYRALDFTDI